MFIIFFIAFLVLCFFIIKPFLTAILTSFALSYIFYPLYQKTNNKIKNKNISSLIIVVLILILILIPSVFVVNTLSREAKTLYDFSKRSFFTDTSKCEPGYIDIACRVADYINSIISNPKFNTQIVSSINKGIEVLIQQISGFLLSIPSMILNFFIMVFVTFFLLRDGKIFVKKIEGILPLRRGHKKVVFNKFNDVTFAVVYGSIIVAAIQGALAGIGYYFAGIRSPIIWALITMLFALVPIIGTGTVWLPASVILMVSGYLSSDNFVILKGILLLLYGAFIVSTVDNFIRPKIIGDRGKVHPVLVLLGVLGGIKLFGFIGFVVGPVVLTLLVALINIYQKENVFQ